MEVINFASFRIPTVWATSEERPRNLPALYERTSDVLQRPHTRYSPEKLVTRSTNVPRTCYNVRTHATHTMIGEKSFVHVQNFFRSLACENESGRVRTFAKRVERSQNVNVSCADRVGRVTTCDKILPHVGHTLMPHI